MLSVVEKLCGRVLIGVRELIENAIQEEQGSFRMRKDCKDIEVMMTL